VAKRVPIGKKKRFTVFKRDGFACQYCGRTPPAVTLEVDHITPVSKGGDNDEVNLVTACFDCNRGKSSEELTKVPAALATQISERRERAEQLDQYNDFLTQRREVEINHIRGIGHSWHNRLYPTKQQDRWEFAGSRKGTIRTFIGRLPAATIYEAVDIAFDRLPATSIADDDQTWAYFCGVCWTRIRTSEQGDDRQ